MTDHARFAKTNSAQDDMLIAWNFQTCYYVILSEAKNLWQLTPELNCKGSFDSVRLRFVTTNSAQDDIIIVLPLPFRLKVSSVSIALSVLIGCVNLSFAQTEATSAISHSIAPDSVDYALWAREALSHGLHGFSVRAIDISDENGRIDTLSQHFADYKLTRDKRHVVLSANTIEGESWLPLSGTGDSVAVEFDSAGREISESRFAGIAPISSHLWKYDEEGRLIRSWYEFANDGWHPPEDFIYNPDGTLQRVELHAPDGAISGSHSFHERDAKEKEASREVVEYDTAYSHGRGLLTAVQLTAFDTVGRVERYQYRSVGLDRAFRIPFGFLNIYRDTLHGYKMEQYSLIAGPKKTTKTSFASEPSRWVTYDSIAREEARTTIDSSGQKLVADNVYLPDERYLSASLRTKISPIQSIACNYTPQGLLESVIVRDLLHGWTRVLQFSYIYTSTGP